jgi:hypothetical protein
MKKLPFFILLSCLCLSLAVPAAAQQDILQDTPEWLKRTEFSFQWESEKKPVYYLQTVQPLYADDTKQNTVFIQPRVSNSMDEATYNVGFGYRRLVNDNLLVGVNLFGDYEDTNEHARAGVGVEALGQVFEARINSYFGLSSKKCVQEDTSVAIYERVADGLDMEVGMPVPYLPWLKVYGSGFWYDFKKFDDKVGWKSRMEAKMNDAIKLEFFAWDDNKGGTEYGGQLRCTLAFDGFFDFSDSFEVSDEPFPSRDLKKSTLIPVERSFDITVESWSETKSGGLTVEVGRAS